MKSKILKSINKDIEKSRKFNKSNKPVDDCIEEVICKSLIESTNGYNPKLLFDEIYEFVSDNNLCNRVLLSKIVDNLYSLQDPQTDIFITNLEQLKNYSENIKDEKYSDSKKFVIKLYDYIKLSNNQNIKVEKFVKEYFDSQIKDAKTNLNDEVKTIQNQYIVILGIFASFIVTFVGGLSFSSSVLNGISSISIYRLIVVILLLGFILFTICFSLYWFLAHIIIKIDTTNLNGIYRIAVGVFVILLIICFAFWHFGAVENRNKRFVSTSISTYSEIASLK